ncbi:MAG: FGGY-family carbohydrate kinase [Oscillospiraceae bacterium]|nr:FGGY-family carbohydrate kinase [Oscillospiraceae bacterium]
MVNDIARIISEGGASLGIELGSTRIKAVLIDGNMNPVASGSHTWENKLENGLWTYSLDAVREGLQDAYKNLKDEVREKYGVEITALRAAGFSAMMHGYLVFDKDGKLLTPFRTWRNTVTGQAAEELTELFGFNIPQRWSIAHLYQAILNGEEHVKDISFITTLAGYVHWVLTGDKVLGVGEASGMFPIDSEKNDYDSGMLSKFADKISGKNYPWNITEILPKVLMAGDACSRLTDEGALFLDPTGTLKGGCIVCPPEGDAGTGMVATNSVAQRTGNISAGTSVFAMIVLEKALNGVYPEIDMVTTPDGKPVAMVHCNNCTSDLDAWVRLFKELNAVTGAQISTPDLYDALYAKALEGAADCGGVISYNYYSGEPVTGLSEGRPLLVRRPDADFSLANFMRAQLFAAMATLKLGMDLLYDKEKVSVDCLMGHGGLFKTPVVGQRLMAAAMNAPVAVMKTAAEGGAWGIAVLAAYAADTCGLSLGDYLNEKVFADTESSVIEPYGEDVDGFNGFMKNYTAGLAAEKAAVESIK